MVLRPALFMLEFVLAACGPTAPQAPPIEIQPSQAEAMLHQTTELDHRRVVVEGYVHFDDGRNGEAIAAGPQLRSGPFGAGEMLGRFDLEYGSGPNQLDLHVLSTEKPPGFPGAPDIITFDRGKTTWRDASGASHPLSQKVRMTGTVRYFGFTRTGPIGQDDPRSPTGKRYKPLLTKVVLEVPAR